MSDNIHNGHRERLKDKYRRFGLDGFTDVEAIELLLFYAIPRRDTNELAHVLLREFKTLRGVLEADLEQLSAVPGLGMNAALLIKLVTGIDNRYHTSENKRGTVVRSSNEAGIFLLPYFSYRNEECCMLLCLDSGGKVLNCHRLSNGSPNMVGVDSREVTALVLRDKASRVILAHNHVSGVALPSGSDRETTARLYRLLRMIGVELEDHLVVCDGDFVSMRDSGLFPEL